MLASANSAYKADDGPAAIRLYREFLAKHPDAAEIRSNLGAALVRDAAEDCSTKGSRACG